MKFFKLRGAEAVRLAFLVAVSISVPGQGATYDLAADFSATQNPNGAWCYGWYDNSQTFNLFGAGPGGWGSGYPSLDQGTNSLTVLLFQNSSPAAYDLAGGRFITPPGGAGTYGVTVTAYRPAPTAPVSGGGAELSVLWNGQSLLGEFVSDGQTRVYSTNLVLSSGDYVDIMEGPTETGYGPFYIEAVVVPGGITNPSAQVSISPTNSFFTNQVAVKITSDPSAVTIYYTLDGNVPNSSSSVYSGPIILTNAASVIAQAYSNALTVSTVVTQNYARVYVTDNLIPAAWLIQYFGTNYLTNPSAASDADPDGDGQSNYQEYLAGTNPIDPSSVFKIADIHLIPLISFETVSNTTYSVLREMIGSTNWIVVGTLTATGNVSAFPDVTSTSTNSAIYEIRVEGR